MKAREIYKDCLAARDLLQDAIDKKNTPQAKIIWFASVAMLRAVGHVLKNVDSKSRGEDFEHRLGVKFKEWKEDPIFRDFIEKERNSILKEYDSTFEILEKKEKCTLITNDGYKLVTSDGHTLVTSSSVTEFIKGSGRCAGESPVHNLSEALEWWDSQLKDLE